MDGLIVDQVRLELRVEQLHDLAQVRPVVVHGDGAHERERVGGLARGRGRVGEEEAAGGGLEARTRHVVRVEHVAVEVGDVRKVDEDLPG